jgi:hypothetical protein
VKEDRSGLVGVVRTRIYVMNIEFWEIGRPRRVLWEATIRYEYERSKAAHLAEVLLERIL